jgi:hypothetical protein
LQNNDQSYANEYWEKISPHIYEEIVNVEEVVFHEQATICDWDIDVEIKNWVPNPGIFRVRDTKYWRTVDHY